MRPITKLNDYRLRKFVPAANEQGWNTSIENHGSLAKVWIYSAHLDGTVRACGQLLQSAVSELSVARPVNVTRKDIQLAGSAVELLIQRPEDREDRALALSALTYYFSRTKTAQVVPPQGRQIGIHQIVVDWPAPDGKEGYILRPCLAISPNMLTPEHLRNAVAELLSTERNSHPERLPVQWRVENPNQGDQP